MTDFESQAFPLIKRKSWAQERELYSVQQYFASEASEDSSVVVIVVDDERSLTYLPNDFVTRESWGGILHQAFVNLSQKLAQLTWQTLEYSDETPGGRFLALGGDFYASEALLDDSKIEEAHQLLGSEKLLLCRPVRGQLLAMAFDDSETSITRVFLAACKAHYMEAKSRDDQIALDTTVWLAEKGETPEPYMDFIEQNVLKEPEQNPRHKLYTVSQVAAASFFGTALAGFFMIYSNYRSLGRIVAAKWIFVAAALLVPSLILTVVLTPDTAYDRLLPVLSGFLMGLVAHLLQGKHVQRALHETPSRKNTFWKASLVTVLSLLVIFILLVGLLSSGLIS